MGQTIWFLTGNAGKLTEAEAQLNPLGYQVRQLIVDENELYEPQATSLEVVAKSKINQAINHLPSEFGSDDMILVEDAGLFISALDGFPGVYSSYVHSTIGNAGIIRLLHHLTTEDPVSSANLRAARFIAVAALWRDGEVILGEGVCPGHIALQSMEGNGFGYDPIFIPYDLDENLEPLSPGNYGAHSTHGKTFGAVEFEVKHKFSHRSKALQNLFNQLPSA
ncbi:MAG: non-canonical purine NTP pyrophosphatase [Candidatus Thermoplasmatota archaeon]|nr:non-canonical purine NTP pyrophosphatase [Candidatus Thermoplasmatota archaeon]